MALQECGLNLNRSSKELQPHGSPEFPCAGYCSCHTQRPGDGVPWHWHEELEMIYIERGRMEIRIPTRPFLLKQGDCILLNANVLHHAVAAPECKLRSLVFHPALITGGEDSAFSKKYMKPLLACRSFSGCYIDGAQNEAIARWFNCAFDALAGDAYGFEFAVRENLSRICLFLHKEFELEADAQRMPPGPDTLRVQKMLAYIHRNFADRLSLADIAKEADISERECLRCFQKAIQQSPIQYLLKYRVVQGAQRLLESPADSIAEIAASCGFDSQSNFAKIFRRFYRCTPREYRSRQTPPPAAPK